MRTQTTGSKYMSEFHKHLRSTYEEKEDQIKLSQNPPIEPYDSYKRSKAKLRKRRPELVLEPKPYNDEIWDPDLTYIPE